MKLLRSAFLLSTGLGAAALATQRKAEAAAAAPQSLRTAEPITTLKPDQYDRAKMFALLKNAARSKQVFQCESAKAPHPARNTDLAHMVNSLNAFELSFGEPYGRGSLAVLGIFIGEASLLSLNDAMWHNYHLGGLYSLADEKGRPGMKNVYYEAHATPAAGETFHKDCSIQTVAKRGGSFMVCHNALNAQAQHVSTMLGLEYPRVLGDFVSNLVPEFVLVPAGVAAFQLAQEAGWKPFTVA
ncbi:MAG: hypothetical protein KGM44_02430 [bacterium]|nr:hypothetical protein [bacterium]